MGAVIDKKAFDEDQRYLDDAKQNAKIVAGRRRRRATTGYFIEPTLVETDDPGYRLLCEEIFGPVVTAYVYRRRASGRRRCAIVDTTSPYALTGAVFAQRSRARSAQATIALRNAAGNFYINDKPTGAVVGQQPFGGARGVGHERQGGLEAEPRALGQRADDQGDVRAAARLQVPVHGARSRAGPLGLSRNCFSRMSSRTSDQLTANSCEV